MVAVVGALGLYAVPIMIYPLGGALLWILVSGIPSTPPTTPDATRRDRTRHGRPHALPVRAGIRRLGVRSVTANEFVEPRTWPTLLDLLPEHVSDTVATWTRDVPFVASLALGIGLLVGITGDAVDQPVPAFRSC